MATLSASSLSFGSEDVAVAPPLKKPRTESGDGDEDVREEKEEEDEVIPDYDIPDDNVPAHVYHEYMKQVRESDGFEVDYFPEIVEYVYGAIQPWPVADSINKVMPLTELAIKQFNQKEGANIQLQKFLKLHTAFVGGGFNYYITFEAKDAADNQTKTFQAS